MATGASQWGHGPPHPTRTMKVPQLSHRCSPTRRVPHALHSYTVTGRRAIPAGSDAGAAAGVRRRRHAFLRQRSEQWRARPDTGKARPHTGQGAVALSSRDGPSPGSGAAPFAG